MSEEERKALAAEARAQLMRKQSVGTQLMDTLQAELGLTAAQLDALRQHKDAMKKDRPDQQSIRAEIRALKSRIADHIVSSQRVSDELRRILEPTQVARFLLWVEKNHPSLVRLNSINEAMIGAEMI